MNATLLAAYIAGGCTVVMYKATQVERLLPDELVAQECVACSELAILRLNDAEHIVSLQRPGLHLSSITAPLFSDAVCRLGLCRISLLGLLLLAIMYPVKLSMLVYPA